jgi:TRAP-type C4-dicarboxylate transport system substrate-binding protein
MDVPAYEMFWKEVGVAAVGAGATDVSALFESGKIKGFDSSMIMMFASGWHNFVKQVMLSGHAYQPGIVIVSPAGRKLIPPALRATWLRHVDTMSQDSLKKIWAVEKELTASLPRMGVAVVPMPPEIREVFEAKAKLVRDEWRKRTTPAGRRLYDLINRELERIRKK